MRKHVAYLVLMAAIAAGLMFWNFRHAHLLNEPLGAFVFSPNDIQANEGDVQKLVSKFTDATHHNIFHIKLKNNNFRNIVNNISIVSQGYLDLDLSEEYLIVADEKNVMVEKIHWDFKKGVIKEIEADAQGRLYIQSVLYDSYNAYIVKEILWVYDRDQNTLEPVVEHVYKKDEQPYILGNIRSIQPIDKGIAFFEYSIKNQEVTLYHYTGKLKKIFSTHVPNGIILMDLNGQEAGRVVFTTTQSQLGYIADNGDLTFLKNYLDEETTVKRTEVLGEKLCVVLKNGALDWVKPNTAGYELERISYNLNDTTTLLEAEKEKPVEVPYLAYSNEGIREKYLHFAGMIIWISLLVYGLVFAYVYLFQRRIRLMVKLLAILVPLMLVATLYTVSFVVGKQAEDFSDDIKEGKQMQFDKVITLSLKKIDEKQGKNFLSLYLQGIVPRKTIFPEEYDQFSKLVSLDNLKTEDRALDTDIIQDLQGMYLVLDLVRDGKSYKILDSENNFRVFEERDTDIEFIKRVMNGETIYGSTDTYIFCLRPIFDENRKVVGIMQAGMDYRGYKKHNDLVLLQTAVVSMAQVSALFIPLTLLFVYLLLRPVGIFTQKVKEMSLANLEEKIVIRTRDEIEDLSETFNGLTASLSETIHEITQMSSSYHRFVPQELFSLLEKEKVSEIVLGDNKRLTTTIFCAGINNFYEISEDMNQEESFNLINEHLKEIGPIIRQHGGMVDRYLDVGIVAMFPYSTDEAVTAAIEIQKRMEFLKMQPNSIFKTLDIALHSGEILVGIIGEEKRIQSSIVSDIVSMCVLMQSKASSLASRILVSKEAFDDLEQTFEHRRLGRIRPVGRQNAIEVVDIFAGDPEDEYKLKHISSETFSKAVMEFSKGSYQKARTEFVRVLEKNMNDNMARLYFFEVDKRLSSPSRSEVVEELII